jgi:hypothetical protein
MPWSYFSYSEKGLQAYRSETVFCLLPDMDGNVALKIISLRKEKMAGTMMSAQ